MRIDRINSLRHCRVFRDFAWPTQLHDFGKYNLIYGWNGSGKTTLSQIFRDLERTLTPSNGTVILSVDNHELRGTDFPQASIPVRVFNRDFVNENVFPIDGGDVPSILILGKENVENQKRLDSLTLSLAAIEQLIQKAQQLMLSAESSLDDHCIARGGVVKDLLRRQGSNSYNNYDKRNYTRAAQNMVEGNAAGNHVLDETEKGSLDSQYRATPLPDIEAIDFSAPDFNLLREKTSRLLSQTVVSNSIQSLRDDTEVSEWIRSGLEIHQKKGASDCLFCEQTLPAERLYALEGHFSAAYESFIKTLDEATNEIDEFSKSLSSLDIPGPTQFYSYFASDYHNVRTEVDAYASQAKANLDLLSMELAKKKNRPFDAISMGVNVSLLDATTFETLDCLIRKHNKETENLTGKSTEAGRRLEMGLVAEQLEIFGRLTVRSKTYEAIVDSLNRRKEIIRKEIVTLQIEITEHQRPAEELNDDLHNYLGHEELHLIVKDNGYSLTRNGIAASQLSEGEITAIALLYFLKSLTDHRFDLLNGVVVLDDPVSSLDANSLFLAYGFIQERTKGVGQLFVFTHNFTFFRQVRNWFHHIKGQNRPNVQKRPSRFYMLNCRSDEQGRHSTIQQLDPLLERYESDYHYLFFRILESSTSTDQLLEANYSLPNMARRLLESFLAFRQPDISGELSQKMQNIDFDEAKKSQILRFVHTYSHNDTIAEPDHDASLLSEAPIVLISLLELIEKEDPRHFERMKALVSRGEEDEGE